MTISPGSKMPAMDFAAKLKALCQAKNWDQSDLVRQSGDAVSASTMSNYFSGRSKPPVDVALKFARALDVSLDFLADDELDGPPSGDGLTADQRKILEFAEPLTTAEAIARLMRAHERISEARVLTPEEAQKYRTLPK